jgi:meckelin
MSVWRTLFVANEFNELNVLREVNIVYTLIISAFFLTGLKMENYSSEIPSFSTENDNL